MNSRKKLFDPEDFDKKKKLFTPSDFDKESEVNIPIENQNTGYAEFKDNSIDGKQKSSSKKGEWILDTFVLVCLVVWLWILIFKSGDKALTDSRDNVESIAESSVPSDSLTNTDEAGSGVLIDNEEHIVNDVADLSDKESKAAIIPVESSGNSSGSARTANNAENILNDVEAEAMKVIRGDYGVGQERKDKLGTKYQNIQSRVNELKREGIF